MATTDTIKTARARALSEGMSIEEVRSTLKELYRTLSPEGQATMLRLLQVHAGGQSVQEPVE